MRVVVLSPGYPPMPGGVSDYTRRFSRALAGRGCDVTVIASAGAEDAPPVTVEPAPGWGLAAVLPMLRRLAELAPDVVVVQYVPHMYERRGMPAGLPALVLALGARGVPVVTMAHELYYGRHEGLRVQPAGMYQRLILGPIFAGSRRVVLTVPARLARMRRVFKPLADRFSLMPVAANMDPAPAEAAAAFRAGLGLPEDTLLLSFLGLAHPSKEAASLACALDRLQAEGVPARLVLVGGLALDHPLAIPLGYLPPAEAAAAIAASDMVLLPFADGASTRRTSLMNAIAAGRPVLSTAGAQTDGAEWPPDALLLAPAQDPAAFAEAAVTLARDPARRAALGAAGRALYEARFAWDHAAERWMRLLAEAAR